MSPKLLLPPGPGPRPAWSARDHSPGALLERRRAANFGGFEPTGVPPEGSGSHASASMAALPRAPASSVSASGSAASAAAPSSQYAADGDAAESRPGPETARRTFPSFSRSPGGPFESVSPPSARSPNARDRACVVRSRRACVWRARAASLREEDDGRRRSSRNGVSAARSERRDGILRHRSFEGVRNAPTRAGSRHRDAAREKCGVVRTTSRAKRERVGERRALRVLRPRLCRPIVTPLAPERTQRKSARRFSTRGARGGDAPHSLLSLRYPALDRRAARRRRNGLTHRGGGASHRPSRLTVTMRSRKAIAESRGL